MSSTDKFMTPSDRIKALCDEALKKPEITVTEKMFDVPAPQLTPPSTSRLKVQADSPEIEQEAVKPTPEHKLETPAEGFQQDHTEKDSALAAMLDEREAKLKGRGKRVRLVANLLLLFIIVAPVTTVAVNPTLRGKFEVLVQRLGEGVDDVKSIGNTEESFDKALDQVAVHNDHINNATAMLGVDPNSVTEDDDLEMTAEMHQFMGKDAEQFQNRKANLSKMGFLAKQVADATGIEKEEELTQ